MMSDEFKHHHWRAHSFLAGIALHSIDRVELPGGRPGMTLAEISGIVGFGGEVEMELGPVTGALFWLRGMIGRILGWDDVPRLVAAVSYIDRLSAEDRARSAVTPGQPAGISRLLYQFDNEMLGEIINRTVHCFWLLAAEHTANGYILWIAVYVRKLNWFTPIYLALISPLLKWIVYPAMIRGVKRRWEEAFPAGVEYQRPPDSRTGKAFG